MLPFCVPQQCPPEGTADMEGDAENLLRHYTRQLGT